MSTVSEPPAAAHSGEPGSFAGRPTGGERTPGPQVTDEQALGFTRSTGPGPLQRTSVQGRLAARGCSLKDLYRSGSGQLYDGHQCRVITR